MVGDISLATRTEVLCAIRTRYRCCTAYASPSLRWRQSALAAVGSVESGSTSNGESLESFLSQLPDLWRRREVRPTHTRRARGPGSWRTRPDPFEGVWCEVLAGSSSSRTRNCSHFVGSSRPATSPIRSFGFDQCHIAKLSRRWSSRLRTVTPSTARCADSTSVLPCPRDNHTRGPNYPPSKYGTPLFHFVPPCSTSDTNRGTPTVPFFGKVFHRPDRNGTLWNTMEQLTR